MRLTGSVPVDPNDRFTQRIKSLEQQVAELQRIKAWGVGWGKVPGGLASVTANQGSIPINATTDLTGLSVDIDAVAGRQYKITGHCVASLNNDATQAVIGLIRTGGTSLGRFGQAASVTTNTRDVVYDGSIPWTGSGATTLKLSFFVNNTGASVTMAASSTTPAFILVEDIGPA